MAWSGTRKTIEKSPILVLLEMPHGPPYCIFFPSQLIQGNTWKPVHFLPTKTGTDAIALGIDLRPFGINLWTHAFPFFPCRGSHFSAEDLEQGAEMVATVWKWQSRPHRFDALPVSQNSRYASLSWKFAPSRVHTLHCTKITGAKQKSICFKKQTHFLVFSEILQVPLSKV